jgi:hypothetical protein
MYLHDGVDPTAGEELAQQVIDRLAADAVFGADWRRSTQDHRDRFFDDIQTIVAEPPVPMWGFRVKVAPTVSANRHRIGDSLEGYRFPGWMSKAEREEFLRLIDAIEEHYYDDLMEILEPAGS